GEPQRLVARLLEETKFPGAEDVVTIDGVRADYADGFGLIRASNTTPVLVLRFEGHTPDALERIEHDFMAALRAVKPAALVAQLVACADAARVARAARPARDRTLRRHPRSARAHQVGARRSHGAWHALRAGGRHRGREP